MPVHIYGAGGGGGAKNALTVFFTPTDAHAHTFTIDDVDFARRFNEAKTTKHFGLIFAEYFMSNTSTGEHNVYSASKGVINGVESQGLLATSSLNYTIGDGSAVLWDGAFEISDNSASFAVSLVGGVALMVDKKYRATWICEE